MIKTIELPLPFTNLHNLLELYKWYKNYRSQNKTFFALKVGRGTGKFLSIKSILDVIPKQCLCSRIKQARSGSKLAAEKLKLSQKYSPEYVLNGKLPLEQRYRKWLFRFPNLGRFRDVSSYPYCRLIILCQNVSKNCVCNNFILFENELGTFALV